MTGPLLLIAVAIGVTGGLSTGLMAAGLRAQTAVDRLLAQTKLPDMMVFDPSLTSEQTDQIRRAAEIAAPETRRLDRNGVLMLDLPPEGVALIELSA